MNKHTISLSLNNIKRIIKKMKMKQGNLSKYIDEKGNHYYNLKENSCYFIKTNHPKNILFSVYDPNDNLIHNRKISNINIVYTNIEGVYKFIFSKNIDYTIEFLSKNSKSLSFDWCPKLIFSNIISDNIINTLSGYENVYLILFNSVNVNDNINDIVKCYTIFSNITREDFDSLKILLTFRLGESYPCYYFQNNILTKYPSYEYLISNIKYNFKSLPTQSKIASLATYPKRKEIIKETIKSLYNQIDVLNIFFNSYNIGDVNNIIKKYNNIKYIIDSIGDCRAAGKFFTAYTNNYNFICDDDIIYPTDYTKKSIYFLKKYPNSIHSYMGAIFKENITEFPGRGHREKYIHFTANNNNIMLVHLIGTGVMYYYGKNILAPFDVFLKHVCFNDDLLAIYSKKYKIPMYTVPKTYRWLTPNQDMEVGLYDEKVFDPVKYDIIELYKHMNPWKNNNTYHKNKYIVLINSYNRYDKLTRLIEQIQEHHNIHIIIVNDCSDDLRYIDLDVKYNNITVLKNEENHGKQRYWETVNKGLKETKTHDYEYILHFDDDMILSKHFFPLLNKHLIYDNFMITFQIQEKQIKWGFENWVDCCFVSPRSFWEKINYQIDTIHKKRWKHNKNLSSGVWQQVSKKLNMYGYKVIFPDYSLCFHDGNDDSKLNSELRHDNKLNTWKFYDTL